ncbi:T9SS type A sorting domain-containing protein [Cytophaga hutchinsonii]|uniref:Secretion system C-terminal sorting domain-containing protein n=1 Tax=Cytophaga hutchinsonii (strain ATCC 33406 / DSM 1761 / CIP 103989 / NBRC 15051 / NCIMB 9469 / D465) TaxID=269798 RepID=A0A6N4SPF3_CYTH3|nr:T9SS type A sorting domain-containing protein [Cytophaga hutchinsonii]ABG58201.1 hypothetical protein CHU_0922 [Cytophaga hutchinsonii ATCC 33406]SFX55260.1 Por secretion system C-terminal sorting domain-containing protein [Cytophaga hutchinsonii ATCC 33406]
MKKLFFPCLLFVLIGSMPVLAQVSIVPLTQYNVGETAEYSASDARTAALTQTDTLKLPYIEDFSGPQLPIDTIKIVAFTSTENIYEIKQLKLHPLLSGDSIRILNAFGSGEKFDTTAYNILGKRFVKVLDKYTFQLFNDRLLTVPTTVNADPLAQMQYCNWYKLGINGYSTKPDVLGFLDDSGGVYINDNMSLNPVSIGVASFDAIKYTGFPYSNANVNGYADKLTSLPFNLSSYKAKDSVYFSFYWQSKSFGDTPESSAYLILEFKNRNNVWQEVWRKYGDPTQTIDTFRVVNIPLKDTLYRHKGFQYRFRNYGLLSGRFNVWNIDYIYINSKRTVNAAQTGDLCIVNTSRSILTEYTSIPYKHFISLSSSDQADLINQDLFFTLRDLRFGGPALSSKNNLLVRDNLGNTISNDNHADITTGVISRWSFPSPVLDPLKMDTPYVVKQEYSYNIVDYKAPIDLSFNNFKAIETYFYDYYAYDDGIPEDAFEAYQRNGEGILCANKFDILKEDSLTHIDFCFIKNFGPSVENSIITMAVWKDGTAIEEQLSQQITVKYSTIVNGFVRYAVTPSDKAKLAAGTYYFGFKHFIAGSLFVGYDRNNDNLDKIVTSSSTNTTWTAFNTNANALTGTLMIRPVFKGKPLLVTDIEDQAASETSNTFILYPNPSAGELHFTGAPEYISIYDLTGKLIQTTHVKETDLLDISALNNGLYVVVLQKADYSETKRLAVQK